MKKVILISAVLLLALSFDLGAKEVWKITSLNWEPYSGAEISNQGNSIQKLRGVLSEHGIELVVEFYPWKRAQKLARTKEYVGYFPAWPEEVKDGFVASPTVDWSEIGLLKTKEKRIKFKNIDDLFKNHKVGIIKTYVYPDSITNAMHKYPGNVDDTPNERSLLKKLSKGRNSVAITDPNVMIYLAEKEGMDNIEAFKTLMRKELVVALRNDSENRKRIEMMKKIFKK